MSVRNDDTMSARKNLERRLHAVADGLSVTLVAQYFGGCPPAINKMMAREDAILYRLTDTSGTERVLRLSSNPFWKAKNTEKSYDAWRSIGVPVPEVFASGEASGLQFIIMEYLNGDVFTFDKHMEQQVAVMRNMGSLLATMHTVKMSGYGYLDRGGKGTFKSWDGYLAYRYTPRWIVESGHLTSTQASLMKAFIADIAREQIEPVLLHGDFKPKNMFVGAMGNVIAVTDPQLLVGDALWDIAIYNHFIYREQVRQRRAFKDSEFMTLRSIFVDAYEQGRGSELNEVELSRLSHYEHLVDAEKAERLLRKSNNVQEGEGVLSYLRLKLDQHI
jgi:aminoglycoside phosphotransferase (APT) family kinase protein